MLELRPEDTHIFKLLAKPPSEWGERELSATDIAKLAVAVHSTALIAVKTVARAAGVDIPMPADVNMVSIIDFGQMTADEVTLHHSPQAAVIPEGH